MYRRGGERFWLKICVESHCWGQQECDNVYIARAASWPITGRDSELLTNQSSSWSTTQSRQRNTQRHLAWHGWKLGTGPELWKQKNLQHEREVKSSLFLGQSDIFETQLTSEKGIMRRVWEDREGADGQLAGLNKYCQSITINVLSHGDHKSKTLLNSILQLAKYVHSKT